MCIMCLFYHNTGVKPEVLPARNKKSGQGAWGRPPAGFILSRNHINVYVVCLGPEILLGEQLL